MVASGPGDSGVAGIVPDALWLSESDTGISTVTRAPREEPISGCPWMHAAGVPRLSSGSNSDLMAGAGGRAGDSNRHCGRSWVLGGCVCRLKRCFSKDLRRGDADPVSPCTIVDDGSQQAAAFGFRGEDVAGRYGLLDNADEFDDTEK